MARIAKSLDVLRTQVNTLYPNRSKASDGWLGDQAHAARTSDHNPNSAGVVCALDITHDPAHGVDTYKMAEVLRANRDPRIKYVISNRKIFNNNWQWRPYNGANPHNKHIHISVGPNYDSGGLWTLQGTSNNAPVASSVAPGPTLTKETQTMSKNTYDQSIKEVLKHEGGYVNHPADPGGPTNFGITLADYRRYINSSGTASDVQHMSVEQAKKIYKDKYWNAMNCDRLPAGVDFAMFDFGVNSGIGKVKVLQKILNVEQDGHVGENTIAAANARDSKQVINALCDARMAYLKKLRIWPTFGRGWTTRVNSVRSVALQMATKKPNVGGPAVIATTIGAGGGAATVHYWNWLMAHPKTSTALAIGAVVVIYGLYEWIKTVITKEAPAKETPGELPITPN